MENLIPSLHPVYKMPSGPREDWLKTTTPIDQGIGCLATDTNELRIGNGRDLYKDLPVIKRIPTISMIVAITNDDIIGNDDVIPMDIEDKYLKFLHVLRIDKVVVVGNNTYMKFPYFKYYNCIVITTDRTLQDTTRAHYVYSKEEAYAHALSLQKDVLVVGGKYIYEMFLPYIDKLYMATDTSWRNIEGNIKFPQFDKTELPLNTVYIDEYNTSMFIVKYLQKK